MRKSLKITLSISLLMGMLLVPNVLGAQEDGEFSPRPCIGVRLDANPLGELLAKHLKLHQDQGLLIINVMKGSAADEVKLERDDIIVGFEGDIVTDYRDFVARIREKSVGDKVKLEIIHLGERRPVEITLGACDDEGAWKYPFNQLEEELLKKRRFPGRIFRLEPGQESWRQIPFRDMPEQLHRYFHQKRVISIDNGENKLEIEIDGDPRRDDARITVRDLSQNKEFRITPDSIDELPEKYREPVRDALENAESAPKDFDFRWDIPHPQMPDLPDFKHGFDVQKFTDRINRQMQGIKERMLREMDERLEQLERSNRQLRRQLNRLLEDKPDQPSQEKPNETDKDKDDSAKL